MYWRENGSVVGVIQRDEFARVFSIVRGIDESLRMRCLNKAWKAARLQIPQTRA
jgi:hypothetical protein